MSENGSIRHASVRAGRLSVRRAPALTVGVALVAGLLGACTQGTPKAAAPAADAPAAATTAPSPTSVAAAPGGLPTTDTAAPAAAIPGAPAAGAPAGRAGTAANTGSVAPSALGTVARFITAAKADDARLRAAAAALNKVATPTTLTFNRATATTAAAAANPRSAAALPAGLPDPLESAALQVYSDLVSRAAPFYYIAEEKDGTVPRTDGALEILLIGLKKNSPIAAGFPVDLAELERVAGNTAPVPHVKANSTPAAELALMINWIQLHNHGCGGTGGYASGYLPKIVWKRQGSPQHWFDGTIGDGAYGGIQFTATFRHGAWQTELNAC